MELKTSSAFNPRSKHEYGNGILPSYTHHIVRQTIYARAYGFRLLVSFIGLICLSLGILRFSSSVLIGNNKKPLLPTIHSDSGNPSYLIEARHGAVATENHRCSIIGVDILKRGGNAVDAAVGATFCIGVVNMFSCVGCML
jgi:hypothetical protein